MHRAKTVAFEDVARQLTDSPNGLPSGQPKCRLARPLQRAWCPLPALGAGRRVGPGEGMPDPRCLKRNGCRAPLNHGPRSETG